jgi:uncharacterized protein (TIGR02594 family)
MSTEKEYRVVASALNVREAPSITASVVGHLHEGDIVQHISTSGDGYWLKIKKDVLEGWSSHKYLTSVVPGNGSVEEFPWIPIALAELGVKEYPGDRDNPRIVEYLKSTNLGAPYNSNDETYWCSAFVNWCIERSGYEGTDSAWARSWLNWGQKVETPRRGCVVVFSREANSGHVAFYVGETPTEIQVLGGNQSDEVNTSNYPKSRVLGYRLPG